MLLEFFAWWYGRGWLDAWRTPAQWTKAVEREFSVSILLSTLFSPWKRIISRPGASLDAKMRALLDNLISRAVGFMVRVLVLLSAAILMFLAAMVGAVLAVIWPFLPPVLVYFVLRSIKG